MGLNETSKWVVIGFLVILHSLIVAANDGSTMMVMNIGVFVDPSTRTGKEQTIGVEIAAEDFNNKSENNKVELHFRNSRSNDDPLQAAYSAIELIKEKKIEALITGTENSEEVALMEEIANQYQVPVLSLAAASLSSPSRVEKHSFLVQLTNDYTTQINCTAMLVQNFRWKQVIAVYEDGGDLSTISSMLDLFSKELQSVGSEIEHLLALPPVASMPNSKELLIEEIAKVFSMQSRVFVVLDSSLSMAIQLFKEANNMGLMGRETAWIVTDSIASLLDSLNSSTRSYMEGTLGVKTYYDEYSQNFMAFSRAFLLKMIAKFPNEQSFHPGIHALRAYDAITIIGNAFERKKRQEYSISTSPDTLMDEILSSKFTGLSGKILIKNGALDEDVMLYRIVNVVGKSYKELDFWSPKIGFIEKLSEGDHKENSSEILNKMLNGIVNWPGDINHVPIGYTMPSTMKPLKIGIPGKPPFDKFVIVETLNKNKTTYTGFCIDVFLEVVKIVEESYGLPYEFEVYNGTYDELVYRVYDKTYDAAVGDITILANRSNLVEFTQPYTKSGLSMIVPLKSKDSHKARMLMKPFSWKLWLVTLGTLLYTMFGVWWIESRIAKNSDFEGSLTTQLNSALWYTFSSIFFAQRENIQSNLTRPLVAVWMFVVFVMTSSYTASLTAMLTVPLLEPIKVKDVEWLKNTNSPIGCDGGSVWDYLVNVKGFKEENIINVTSQYDYQELFDNDKIVAAFLELPYKKLLVNQYCKSFTSTKHTFGFGAQGFVFQKGSPIVNDVSKAILKISENGVLKELEDKWFTISECPTSSNVVERLNPKDFLALYIVYGVISIICLLSSVAYMIRRYRAAIEISPRDRSIAHRMINFAQFYHGGNHRNSQITPITENFPSVTQTDDWVGRTLELSTRTT